MSRARILLADDNPNMLELVQSIVEPRFEVVGRVADGKSLSEVARGTKPDVIITDISMPILNGIEAVKKLKESGCRSRIVFLTVHSEQMYVRACFDVGACGYLVKLQMASDLLDALHAVLAGRNFVSPNLTYQS